MLYREPVAVNLSSDSRRSGRSYVVIVVKHIRKEPPRGHPCKSRLRPELRHETCQPIDMHTTLTPIGQSRRRDPAKPIIAALFAAHAKLANLFGTEPKLMGDLCERRLLRLRPNTPGSGRSA